MSPLTQHRDESSNKFTTQSLLELSNSSFGTTDGLTVGKNQHVTTRGNTWHFQDGKFENVGGSSMSGSLTRKYHLQNKFYKCILKWIL